MAYTVKGIKIDYPSHKIVLNRGFAKKAENPYSQEYCQLQKVVSENPTYEVVVKDPIKKPDHAVERYKGLNKEFIYDYIAAHDNADENLKEFNQQQWIAKCHGDKFGILRKWFLEKYPECKLELYNNFDKEDKNQNAEHIHANAEIKNAA